MIQAPTILPLGGSAVRLSWNGTAGATVRVFVNGGLAYGPVAMAATGKVVDLEVPTPATIEVHETGATETVPSASIELRRSPRLWWSSVPGTASYRIYFDNQLLAEVLHEPSRLHHEHQVTQDVRQDGGHWVGFRVVAVSASGRESDTLDVPFFAPGAPAEPSSLSVTGSSGVFNVTLGLA